MSSVSDITLKRTDFIKVILLMLQNTKDSNINFPTIKTCRKRNNLRKVAKRKGLKWSPLVLEFK